MSKQTKLSQESFNSAVEFIRKHARSLDRARFEFHFSEGSVEQVIEELEQFQNPDGGFGNAIEPDMRMPSSSALFTSVGFQTVREIELGIDNDIVRKGIEYISRNYSEEFGGWEPNPPEVQNYPRAQWWEYEPVGDALSTIRVLNPGAELLGYLLDYSKLVDERIIETVTKSVLRALELHLDDPEFHALLCAGRLLSTDNFSVGEDIESKFKLTVREMCETGSTSWDSYGAKPLWFVNAPASYLGDELNDLCEKQLQFELEQQHIDGSWIPNWNWGRYEAEWEEARVEWSGYLTVQNLIAFRNWDWIEN